MGNAKLDTNTQWVIAIAMIILAIGSFTWMAPTVNVTTPTAEEIAAAIVIPTMTGNISIDNSKLNAIYDELLRDDNAEDVAETLALDELETKDFKKELVKFLLNNTKTSDVIQDIDYKDIEDIIIRDVDANVTDETATVDIEFKVYVSNYGDEDEEEKARIAVSFTVNELDEDDDYEDAEVLDVPKFTLIRFYD